MSTAVHLFDEATPMSNPSSSVSRERVSRLREVVQSASLQRGVNLVAAPLRFVAFWAAIALPFLYLPLFFSGLDGQETLVFGLLLAANAVALVVGHGHRQ